MSFPTRESIAEMPPAPPPAEGAEDRIRLRGVDRALFGRLAALGSDPTNPRVAWLDGELELMAPSTRRTALARRLDRLVGIALKATGVPSFGTGRVTLARPDSALGKVAEAAFYIAQVDRGPSRRAPAVDLGVHPPPDLVIEVALGRPLVDVERLHAGLGVPELWRCDGRALGILRLGSDGRYAEQGHSDAVPRLRAADVMPLLAPGDEPDDARWERAAHRWAREELANRTGRAPPPVRTIRSPRRGSTMSTASTPAANPTTPSSRRPYRFSAAAFARIIAAKVFDDHRRIELRDGLLFDLPEPDQPRVLCRGALADALTAAAAVAGGHVRVDAYLRLADRDVPRPDVMVVRGHRHADATELPTPADVALVVEVVESGVPAHLDAIAAAYAAGGVPVYWCVDLAAARIEAFADPTRVGVPGYRRRQAYGPGRTIPVALPGRLMTSLVVDDLLPARPAR